MRYWQNFFQHLWLQDVAKVLVKLLATRCLLMVFYIIKRKLSHRCLKDKGYTDRSRHFSDVTGVFDKMLEGVIESFGDEVFAKSVLLHQ